MKIERKFLAGLLAAILALSLAFVSCGGDDDSSSDEPALTDVSISGKKRVLPEGNIELKALPTTTGSPEISYTWSVTDGASLNATTGETVTLTAGSEEKTVKVSLNAKSGETEKNASLEVKITTSVADLIVTPGAKVTTYGWADMANSGAGMSYPDTTNIIVIDDTTYPSATAKRTAFTNAIASGSVSSGSVNDTKAIIVLSGTVDLSDGKISDNDHSYFDAFNSTTHAREHGDIVYEIGSNKAIIGVKGAKVAFGGLQIYANKCARENIIIQNIDFWDAHGSTEKDTSSSGNSSSKASADNLVLESNGTTTANDGTTYNYVPTNIWIDHCKFSDGTCSDLERNYNHDGSLDMKAGKNVTVSYCEFTNHDKVTLLAPNDNYADPTQRQITFHHNYYHDAIQRMPRSRGCQLHIYNNYYNKIGTSGNGGYSLGPGIGSQFIVESNYFGTHQYKILKYFDSSASTTASTFSKLYATGNTPELSDSTSAIDSTEKTGATASNAYTTHKASSAPWTINYTYKADAASNLPTLIPAAAGTDKEDYTAIVEVNGTTY